MTETGYGKGEALILALVQAVTGFTAGNATRGDWKILNQGKASRAAILRPGSGRGRTFDGHNQVTEQWTTLVEIWERYKDDGTSLIALEADVEAVVNKIDVYPHLGDTTGYVYTVDVTEIGEPQEMWTRGGGPAWMRQIVTVEWSGQRVRTFLD